MAGSMACGPATQAVDQTDGGTDSTPADSAVGTTCDFWGQDCPEGMKCAPIATEPHANFFEEHRCVIVLDEAAIYESCESYGLVVGNYDNCGPGMMCWGAPPPGHPHEGDENVHGHCMSFCQGNAGAATCAGEFDWCTSTSQGVVNVCNYNCDPLGHDCEPDQRCLWEPGLDRFLCAFAAPESGEFLDDCTGCGNCCATGLYCADAADVPGCATEQCCNAWCDTDDPDACPQAEGGQSCVGFWPTDGAPPNHEPLGQGQCLVQ
jgi:hypothetical protein